MGGFDDLAPLRSGQFVAREHEADRVIEDFGRCPRGACRGRLLSTSEGIARTGIPVSSMPYTISMGENAWVCMLGDCLHRPRIAGDQRQERFRGSPALNADLSRAPWTRPQAPCRATSSASRNRTIWSSGLTLKAQNYIHEADVGEIDVAGNDVADHFANQPLPISLAATA